MSCSDCIIKIKCDKPGADCTRAYVKVAEKEPEEKKTKCFLKQGASSKFTIKQPEKEQKKPLRRANLQQGALSKIKQCTFTSIYKW